MLLDDETISVQDDETGMVLSSHSLLLVIIPGIIPVFTTASEVQTGLHFIPSYSIVNIEWNAYPHNLWENRGSLGIPLRIKAFLFQDWLSMKVKRNCVALQMPWQQLNPTWTLNIKTCNHCKAAMPLNVIRLQVTASKWLSFLEIIHQPLL